MMILFKQIDSEYKKKVKYILGWVIEGLEQKTK